MVMLSYLTPMKVDQQAIPGYPHPVHHHCFVSPPQAFLDSEPTSFDILLGKEKAIFNHSGNRKFRAIINSKLDKYIVAPTKSSKTKLIRQVHSDMKKAGYRFLRKNEATRTWNEIETHEAREKVSHALRDRVREQQKPAKRQRKSKQSPPSPTSVMTSESSNSEEQKPPKPSEDDPSNNEEDSKSKQNLELPAVSDDDDDAAPNDPTRSLCEDPDKVSSENGTTKKNERRPSLLSIDDLIAEKSDKQSSFITGNEEISSKSERRLSMLSLFNSDDICSTTSKTQGIFGIDQEDESSTRPTRRFSLVGIFESLANSSDYIDDQMVDDEPLDHTVDNDINLLEIIHDISQNLREIKMKKRKQNRLNDSFHTMPIADVYGSGEEAKLVDKVIAL